MTTDQLPNQGEGDAPADVGASLYDLLADEASKPHYHRGACVNHRCNEFEKLVTGAAGMACTGCGWKLRAPNGVDYIGEEAAA